MFRYDSSAADLTTLFNSLDGLVFPGGAAHLSSVEFLAAGALLYSLAISANDQGQHFPVWGTCLGFEVLMVLQSKNVAILETGLDSENLTLPLNPTQAASRSRLLGNE